MIRRSANHLQGACLGILLIFIGLSQGHAQNAADTADVQSTYQLVTVLTEINREFGRLQKPSDVAIDADGHIYIVDTNKRGVIKYNAAGTFIELWTAPEESRLRHPTHIALANGTAYVSDRYEAKIHRFNLDGTYLDHFGEKGSGRGQLNEPFGLCSDPLGNIFVADQNRDTILRFDAEGNFLSEFGVKGDELGHLFGPTDIACDTEGNVYVVDYNDRVQKFSATGSFIKAWGESGEEAGQFNDPAGINFDPHGNLYIADTLNGRIQIINPYESVESTILTAQNDSKPEFERPSGVAASQDGIIVVVDSYLGKVSIWVSESIVTLPQAPTGP